MSDPPTVTVPVFEKVPPLLVNVKLELFARVKTPPLVNLAIDTAPVFDPVLTINVDPELFENEVPPPLSADRPPVVTVVVPPSPIYFPPVKFIVFTSTVPAVTVKVAELSIVSIPVPFTTNVPFVVTDPTIVPTII